MEIIIGPGLAFIILTGLVVIGEPVVIAQSDIEQSNYSIWVEKTIHFGGEDGKPAGMACPNGAKPAVEMQQVSDDRWRIRITCAAPKVS